MFILLLQRSFHYSTTKTSTTVTSAAAFSVSQQTRFTTTFGATVRGNIHNNNSKISHNMVKKKVFCFGDSLTAGTAPPSFQEYPYAKHLESKLNELVQVQLEQQQQEIGVDAVPNPYMVRHYGLPGWTATQLSSPEGNLNSILERIKAQSTKSAENTNDTTSNTRTDTNADTGYPSLVIILAGTNDLAYCTNETQCQSIFQSIQSIHHLCHDKNIDTIALTIPSSAWQCQGNESGNNAAMYAKLINDKLESWATERQERDLVDSNIDGGGNTSSAVVHYVPFPIEAYDPSIGYWSSDGLHFSAEGYAFIGESLAPIVKNILERQ